MVATATKRIFIAGMPKSGKMSLLQGLTGSVPKNVPASDHSKLSHSVVFDNKYYKAHVDIWIDEFILESNAKEADESSSFDEWLKAFTSTEAKEVREVLGAVIFTIDPTISAENLDAYISGIEKFLDLLDEEMWDGTALLVSKGPLEQGSRLRIGDLEISAEYVNLLEDSVDKNGEKDGISRIKEALEANLWLDVNENEKDEEEVDEEPQSDVSELDDPNVDPTAELAKMLSSMSTSMLNEDSVDRYSEFISKLRNVRDNGRELNHDERTKLSEELADELLGLI